MQERSRTDTQSSDREPQHGYGHRNPIGVYAMKAIQVAAIAFLLVGLLDTTTATMHYSQATSQATVNP